MAAGQELLRRLCTALCGDEMVVLESTLAGRTLRHVIRSIRNFWRLYRPLADHWLLVYKSGNQPLDIAAGTAGDVTVRDAELYTTFTRRFEGESDG